jgi:DNA-binding response OmpR family regulator
LRVFVLLCGERPEQLPDDPATTMLEEGDFRIDLETRGVTVQTREVHLTPKEYDLLVYLIRHPGKVLTHRTLLAAIWGGNYVEQTEYLRVLSGNFERRSSLTRHRLAIFSPNRGLDIASIPELESRFSRQRSLRSLY